MRQGADTLKRVHFELGGKNPVIVFDDADLDKALDAVVFMIYSLNGERCTSSSRLLIQDSIREEFLQRLTARVNNLNVGHPLNPETEVGPLVHTRHFEKVCSYFDIAKEDGATIAAGGSAVEGDGNYIRPTLFTDARNEMRIAQQRGGTGCRAQSRQKYGRTYGNGKLQSALSAAAMIRSARR